MDGYKRAIRTIEDSVTETNVNTFRQPTNWAVVKAWDAWDRRVVDVYDSDTEVNIERGSRQVTGIGGAGTIIRGIEVRKEDSTPAEELDAWMRVSYFMGDVFPRFVDTDEDRALFLVSEWNGLMDAIAHDEEEASPEIRQAAEDQRIVALGRLKGSLKCVEIYDDEVAMDEILRHFGVLW